MMVVKGKEASGGGKHEIRYANGTFAYFVIKKGSFL